MPKKFKVVAEDNEIDASEEENKETDSSSEEPKEASEKDKREKNTKLERKKRKAEIEAELKEMEDQIKVEAAEAADEVAEDEPETSEVKEQSKDEAEAIAAGYQLTKDEEGRLTESIATKVMEKLGERDKESPRVRTPDRRPKPTHWSDKKILGRRRGNES